jgi:hypothetical protein
VVAKIGEEERTAGERRDHFHEEVPHSWGAGIGGAVRVRQRGVLRNGC